MHTVRFELTVAYAQILNLLGLSTPPCVLTHIYNADERIRTADCLRTDSKSAPVNLLGTSAER